MDIGPLSTGLVIDTTASKINPIPPPTRQDSLNSNAHFTPHNQTIMSSEIISANNINISSNNNSYHKYKPSIIPEHSSLPSPLSPPLSVSPPSFGSSMADHINNNFNDNNNNNVPNGISNSSLPPLHPSSSPPYKQNISTLSSPSKQSPSVSHIHTSPEAWLAHAAQQRKHLSSGSFSSITSASSSALLSPDQNNMSQSPTSLEFTESERIKKDDDDDQDNEEPLNLNIRPSQLRASLMARARQSSAVLQQKKAESISSEARLSVQSNQSYNSIASAFESKPSPRSSISSSISGWAPRARSTSISSQGSNDSVNLDALIAEGSDINEERPIQLEEGDDVDWSKDPQKQRQLLKQQQLQQQQLQQQLQQQRQQNFMINQQAMMNGRSRSTTGGSGADMLQYEDQDMIDTYWSESEVPMTEEDEEFDETLRGFSQLQLKSSMPEVRGLSLAGDRQVTSPRFPDGRNPYDLEADYLDTPAGLRSGDRMSNVSNYSSASSTRSSSSRLPASNASRLPGASGLKAPATRLAQPATRSMLTQPKAGAATASKIGVARPSGLQAPKAGASQVPRSGLQAPRAGSSSALPVKGSNLARPANGRTTPGSKAAPVSRLTPASGASAKSQMAQPNSIRKPTTGGSAGSGSNRQSLLQAPSKISTVRSPTGISNIASPKRTLTAPNLLASPARLSPGHVSSPTSSYSSSSSASARDLSQRLSNATGTSQLTRPKAGAGSRSVSMYGSTGLGSNRDSGYYQQQYQDYEEEEEYNVLTPPLSPSSSKTGSRVLGGIPRSGIQPPSRLVAPSVSTSKMTRSGSPSPLSAGSNSGSQSYLPRSHTPTSSLPVSRITSGLVSPRAGRH